MPVSMAIPDYQTLMQPILALLTDGRDWGVGEVLPALADQFGLTPEERAQLLPSGRQETFRNRMHWASFHLLKARLVERPRRGHLTITQRGRDALERGNPINLAFLRQFPEFREFLRAGGTGGDPPPPGRRGRAAHARGAAGSRVRSAPQQPCQ